MADVRDTMVLGESGILAIYPPGHPDKPVYEPSKRSLTWPSGAKALCYSSESPERLRGHNTDTAWCDEVCSWINLEECWSNFEFGFRKGDPQCCITTTPRPVKLIQDLVKRDGLDVVVTRGSTYENKSNLAKSFIDTIIRKYEGTRLGRQELEAELLTDTPGALWTTTQIDLLRVQTAPVLRRVVIAVDPAFSSKEGSDETGIVVAGQGADNQFYVLADYSGNYTPLEWARKVQLAYHEHKADRILAETNMGFELVLDNILRLDPNLPVKSVRAKKGKYLRAEPVSALYEQGKVHHVGYFRDLENQQTTYTPDVTDSPDRLDAMVYALTELSGRGGYFTPIQHFFSDRYALR